MFDIPGIFYFDRPLDFIYDSDWKLDVDKICHLKKHALVIANFATENYGDDGLDYVYHALEHQKIKFLLLTHDPNHHQRFDKMLFYPHYYHYSRKNFIIANSQSFDKTYKWSCLNATPRPHRIHNYFVSYHKNYFQNACFTFHDDVYTSRHDDIILDDNVTKFWNDIKPFIKSRQILISEEKPRIDTHCNHPAYSDSYIHLVTETTVSQTIFISEKTWKPVASGQLFLVFGNPGIISYLRNQGVDVFDDIIDHSYDSTLDWQLRLDQIHQQLELLISQDLKKIYINTHLRRQANIEKFFSGSFDQKYNQIIQQCINMLN